MRSDAMGHQLLPKRIALPIFASTRCRRLMLMHPFSLTLALAGSMAAVQSVWVGVVVALRPGSRGRFLTGRLSTPIRRVAAIMRL